MDVKYDVVRDGYRSHVEIHRVDWFDDITFNDVARLYGELEQMIEAKLDAKEQDHG